MAGFFSRKSKNGVEAPAEPAAVTPDAQTVYQPLPTPVYADDVPDALPGIPDLYAVLGVDPRASDDIIRYAYRKRAAKLLDARWRPGRAARQLAELNAAYEILGKPDRRADYDRQRARVFYYQQAAREQHALADGFGPDPGGISPLPAARPGRSARRWPRLAPPRGLLEAVAIVGVVLVALYAGYTVLGNRGLVDLGPVQNAGAALGLPIQPRTAPTTVPQPTAPLPTPTPRQVIVPPPALPAATPAPATATPAPPPARPSAVISSIRVSNPTPARRSDVGVTVRLLRNNQPVSGAPVYLTAYFRTVEERHPGGDATVPTNANGEATVTFNIGDATPGHPVEVVVTATVDGESVQAKTSFVPR